MRPPVLTRVEYLANAISTLRGPVPSLTRSASEGPQPISSLTLRVGMSPPSSVSVWAAWGINDLAYPSCKPIELRFEKTSLEDVFKFIDSAIRSGSNDRGIWIYVDPMGLVEAEKTLATPVSFTVKGEPLKSSLERLMKSISLIYAVKDGYLMITSR